MTGRHEIIFSLSLKQYLDTAARTWSSELPCEAGSEVRESPELRVCCNTRGFGSGESVPPLLWVDRQFRSLQMRLSTNGENGDIIICAVKDSRTRDCSL